MCGIVGVVSRTHNLALGGGTCIDLKAAMDVSRHRGPDDQGTVAFRYDGSIPVVDGMEEWHSDNSFDGMIGFNRLSIKDLSIEGHQPMLSKDKKVILVFNGEIYNDADLRAELIEKGYVFRSSTDTEVILHMYEEYGFEAMMPRLNGMFAIVIVDLRMNVLYMARDRFGIKPLYYSECNGRLYFASEMKSIIQFKEFKRELDYDAFNARIIFARPSEAVLLKNVYMLDPGCALIVPFDGMARSWQFFNIDDYHRSSKYKNIDEAIDALDEILAKAVQRQLVSDVKVGCQVSGGIDSTLVSYYASRAGVDNLNDGVSIVDGTETGKFEEHYIDVVGDTLNLEMHKFVLDNQFFIDNYEKAVWCNDAPIYKPYFLSFYLLAKEAKNYVTVLMSGEGSDETAGGYGRFPAGVLQPFLSKLNLKPGLLKSYSSFGEYEIMSDSTATGITISGYDNTTELVAAEIEKFNRFEGSNFTKQLKYETMHRLPESCMRQDKMTMAASIENRVPLLDNDVVDFIMELPENMLIHFKDGSPLDSGDNPFAWSEGKYIYKQLLSRKFGHEFVYRKKGIMVFDDKSVLACNGFQTLFYDKIYPSMKSRGLVDCNKVISLFSNLKNLGRIEFIQMWRVIALETWCELFLDEKDEFQKFA